MFTFLLTLPDPWSAPVLEITFLDWIVLCDGSTALNFLALLKELFYITIYLWIPEKLRTLFEAWTAGEEKKLHIWTRIMTIIIGGLLIQSEVWVNH